MKRTTWLNLVMAAVVAMWAGCSDDTGTLDSGPPASDKAVADASRDQGTKPDGAPLDQAQPAPDKALPDQAPPDQMLPDQMQPDQMQPDQMLPDQMIPDQMIPDQMIPDQMPPDAALPALPRWAVSTSGNNWRQSFAIGLDSAGNSYITGRFSGTTTLGSTTLVNPAKGDDIFVAKVDGRGKFVWAVSAGGSGQDQGMSIAVDSAGNSTITGWFSGTASFGSTTLTSKGSYDIFMARLDASGKFVWAISAGSTLVDHGLGVSMDSSGNSYFTGGFRGTVAFGNTTLTAKGPGTDLFVAKLDKSGKYTWVVSSGASSAGGGSIAVDGAGNSYIAGGFGGTVTLGSTTLTSKAYTDMLVAKLDSSGKFVWATAATATSTFGARSIALDGSGNSTITGNYRGKMTLGTTTLTAQGYPSDIFVTRLDKSGKYVWAVSAGGAGDETSFSVAADSSGNSTVTGIFEGSVTFGSTTLTAATGTYNYDIFVTRLDKSGKITRAAMAGGTSWERAWGVALDSQGNTYLTGDFGGSTTFGSTTLKAKGLSDIYVVKMDSTGKF